MYRSPRQHAADRVVTASVPATTADMNVTPLIDVLLVLLIIFMAALPLTQKGLDVSLPQTPPLTADAIPDPTQIVARYDAEGRLTINSQPVEMSGVEPMLREIFATRRNKTLFVIAAEELRYGAVMEVVDAAKAAGVERIGVVVREN